MVEGNWAISKRAAELKLYDRITSFYSGSDFAQRQGLGFEFFVLGDGRGVATPSATSAYGVAGAFAAPWETSVKQKQQQFSENYTTPRTAANPSSGPRT